MSTHWTACTPRQNSVGKRPERSTLLDEGDWKHLYEKAEEYLHTHTDVFEKSIRQEAIKQHLQVLSHHINIQPLPLGVEKVHSKKFRVKWTGADSVLGENNIKLLQDDHSKFCIKVRD